jgi:hypothetical protein
MEMITKILAAQTILYGEELVMGFSGTRTRDVIKIERDKGKRGE